MERTVGPYRFLDRLGSGGLGEAFRARDTRLGRTVVVKCVPAEISGSEGARARLLTTASALKSLSHPHLAELYDVLEEDGGLYLVSEYVEGETLGQVVAGRPLNPRRAAEITAQVADALAQAHSAGVLHLDLRPDTIVITRKGQAKVVDAGLSDFTAAAARRRAVAAGQADGQVAPRSVAYMSPEQALGENEDARSDIFSLGTLFYEMLTGEPPFHEGDASATVLSILRKAPPPPSARNAGVPRYFDPVVSRMLAKSLHGRYDSAAATASALRRLAERSESAPAAAPAARPGRRIWVPALILVVAIVALLGWWLG